MASATWLLDDSMVVKSSTLPKGRSLPVFLLKDATNGEDSNLSVLAYKDWPLFRKNAVS